MYQLEKIPGCVINI